MITISDVDLGFDVLRVWEDEDEDEDGKGTGHL